MTANDKVGNTTTSASQVVEIDDTAFSTTGSSCTNAGNGNNVLAAGDTTDFVLGDTVFPGSVRANWTGTTLTANAILRNGATGTTST